MALLLVSLIIIGFIGLVCHIKYRQLHPRKRLKSSAGISESDVMLEDDANAPFINENLIPDIPPGTESLLEPKDPEIVAEVQTPELTTSLEELADRKKIAKSIAAELLPEYGDEAFIFEHAAILPNIKKPVAEIREFFDMQPARLKNNIMLSATVKKQTRFSPIEKIKARHNVTHLKSEFRLKQKSGFADQEAIKEYETLINTLSRKFDCEYQFALTTEQAVAACETLNTYVKEHDLIIILYILAKPEASFSGTNLVTALTASGLEYGEFKFFHFTPQDGVNPRQKIFSIANMYKPGSFELDAMEKFSTMGLCAFMVPALISDPVSGFNEMCTRCHKIADDLSGVLTTNQRELLNEENFRLLRDRIIDQKHRLNETGVENGSELANLIFS